ncbi:MAG: FtsW/RodA/SpoVE family cell cycle protein [Phycisphaerae bacterium]|nr:putative peptidoglycan glycosyltransferase FtsW [Tepidisphaeraceae bacterium]
MEDSIYRLRLGDILTLCVLGLLALGVVMVGSASMNATGPLELRLQELRADRSAALAKTKDAAEIARIQRDHEGRVAQATRDFEERPSHWYWSPSGTKQFGYALAALGAFFLIGKFDYAKMARGAVWRNPVVWLLVAAAVSCAAVLVPGIGREMNGARRWISLGVTQFQPSELGKWALVVFLAYWISQRKVLLEKFATGFVPTLIPIGIIALLIVIQDFGTAALIGVCSVAILIAGRAKLWHLGVCLVPALLAATWFVTHKAYRMERIMAFRDPFADPQGKGYHMIQSLLSFSTGGVFGKGLGNGVQKLGYLPEDTTDFIFAVVCEELGLFGACLTIALYLGILYVAFQIVKQSRDGFGRLLAFGIGAMIGFQALINIAVATVSVPTKGLSLPLVSFGGSGLVITCGALGLLLSVTKHRHAAEEEQQRALWETDSLALATVM